MTAKARAKVGALAITVDPPGAEVLVNGLSVGKTPLQDVVFVDPGPVFVEARLAGYTSRKDSRTLAPGKREDVKFLLTKVAAGGVVGPTVVVVGSGRAGWPQGPAKWWTPKILIGRGGVVGLVGIILGAGFAARLEHEGKQESRPGSRRGPKCSPPDVLVRRQFGQPPQDPSLPAAGVSMWSFIGAGAAIVGTGAYAVVKLASKPTQAPQAQVTVGMDRVGVTLKLP